MTVLTPEQNATLLQKIEELRTLEGRIALRKNDALFKFICALNANGFIDSTEYRRLDTLRYEALMKIRSAK